MVNFSALSHRLNGKWFGNAAKASLALVPKKMVIPILQGPLRGKRWIVGSCIHSCWLGSYEAAESAQMMALVNSGSVFFDIGAQAGYHTLLASQLVGPSGQVFAFEPVPANVANIRRHVELNGIRNVTIIEGAVSDVEGSVRFDAGANSVSGHISMDGNLNVRVLSLDREIKRGALPKPDFIKIDVEGAEAAVLIGGRELLSSSHPTLFIETHQWMPHHESSHTDCCQFLKALGYEILKNPSLILNSAYHISARFVGQPADF